MILHNVQNIPHFQYSLNYVQRLGRDMNYVVTFSGTECMLHDLFLEKTNSSW